MEVVGTTAKLQPKSSPSEQTNAQLFTGQMLFQSPDQQCQSTVGKDVYMSTQINLHSVFLSGADPCPSACDSVLDKVLICAINKCATQLCSHVL